MQLPHSVQVGPFRYDIEVTAEAIARARADERDDRVGHHDAKGQRLVVDPDQAEDNQADTVLHELLHAVWLVVGLHQSRAEELEEVVIAALSPTLLDTLRRNPELVTALTAVG